MCPSLGKNLAWAFGIVFAWMRPCSTGTSLSVSPYQTWTGMEISCSAKPHGRASSIKSSAGNLPRAGRCVFAATGNPHHGKATESQFFGKLGHNVCPIDDCVWLKIRKSNTRAVGDDDAGVEPSGGIVYCRKVPFQPRTRAAVKLQDWFAFRVTVFGVS